MPYRCIGRKRVNNRRNDRTELIQCTEESDFPSNLNRPDWGWLCEKCANEAPKGPRVYEEPENLGAMQVDPSEFKDLIASGFAYGARRGYEDSSEGDEE